jgi:2-dehydropantoate 2-reductase
MHIAVVGSGALGLYYGALLQRGGNTVSFLLRRDYEAISANGLNVRSILGDFHLPEVRGFRRPEDIGPVDLVLVGLKTFANDSFRALIQPLLGASTLILTLQNGLGNEEDLAALFGADRVLGGVAFLCANRGEPGTVHHLGAGKVEIGAFGEVPPERAAAVAGNFAASGLECVFANDLSKARWQKLVWNIPFNGSCALLGQSVDRLLAAPRALQLVRELMSEVIAAANTQGLSEPIAPSFVELMIEYTAAMGPYRPSMQIDREEGRPLELDAIFFIPLARGRAKGVEMPRIEALAVFLEQSCRL